MRYTAEQLRIAKDRELGLRSFSWFIRNAWPHCGEPTQYLHNWHIDLIAEHLTAVTKGQIRKLIINVPPGSMKSLETCVFWSTWNWILRPSLAQMFASFDLGLTLRDAGKVRTLMTSDWFLRRWGHIVRIDDSEPVREFKSHNAEGRPAGGWRYCTSVDGKATGNHPDIKVIDDPTKPKEATPENLEATNLWWQNTMRSRGRNQATVATVLIMQRLAENDLTGYLLENEDGWVHVNIPLEYDSSKKCVTAWGEDPRTEEGESFDHHRMPLEVIREIKKDIKDAATFSAQYNQDPTPKEGIVFQVEWLSNTWKVLPENGITTLSWDFTFKGESQSDWVVGQAWLKSGVNHYLIDQVRGKWEFTRALEEFLAFCGKHPKALTKLIEAKANGPAIISVVKSSVSGIEPIEVSDSKIARARAGASVFLSGNVWLPDQSTHPWVLGYKAEHQGFPKRKHDDQVDATSQYLAWSQENSPLDYAGALQEWKKKLGIR